jgi:dTDP-4-amino-4,6-dideoxygalactose transaminase
MLPIPAILGGQPLFHEQRHVGAPHVPDRRSLHDSLDAILDSRRLSNNGPFVQRLERALAAAAGCRHGIAVCNATLALQLVFRARRLEGEVIMPAFTFIATAHAATWESLEPVFVDIDPQTHCIDPRAVAAAITPRTAAIVGVHVWGNLCDTDALTRLADARGIPLFFDAAHALGCSGRAGPLGGLGQASVVSLHATKVVSGLEGGAVLTNDDGLAESLRTARNFGFEGYDRVESLGTNAKMNEFSAAFALAGLVDLPQLIVRNAAVMDAYRRGLSASPGIRLLEPDPRDRSNHHYVVAVVGRTCPLDRDELHRVLEAENVLARRYFHPGCHRMMPYAERPAARAAPLPVTERVCSEVLILPAGGSVTVDEAEAIADRIRLACGRSEEIRRRLCAGAATSIRPAA